MSAYLFRCNVSSRLQYLFRILALLLRQMEGEVLAFIILHMDLNSCLFSSLLVL